MAEVQAEERCARCGKPEVAAVHQSERFSLHGHAYEPQRIARATVSILKAVELVGVSRRTIYNWMAAGKVEYVRTAGGSIRIFTDSLWRRGEAPREELQAPLASGVAGRTRPGSEEE